MPLKFTQRNQDEVPSPSSTGKGNPNLIAIKAEMAKLGAGLVLEIQTDSEKAVRGTKMLVTKAGRELGVQWRHWHVGSTVYAKRTESVKRRGRPKKAE